jgi:hypothetical protein
MQMIAYLIILYNISYTLKEDLQMDVTKLWNLIDKTKKNQGFIRVASVQTILGSAPPIMKRFSLSKN